MVRLFHRVVLAAGVIVAGCSATPWNNPYPARDAGTNTLYSSFAERPRHLDPVQSYASNEYQLIANIYQPPLQYHYLKRPFELIPFAATAVPKPEFYDAAGRRLPRNASAEDIAYSDYVIRIRPGIRYQPHPALATDKEGRFVYHNLGRRDLGGIHAIGDFKMRGTRELVAQDYVHQIKRLAHPRLHSPIMQLMGDYIVGLKELAAQLAEENKKLPKGGFLDLTKFDIAGVQATDRYTYRIRVRGKYPQFIYWLAMPFFAPIPPEADRFYAQPGLAERNITLDWFPIGTGPYMLTVNNPNRQMALERNPYYEGEFYPGEGERGDAESGLLKDAGKPLPFVDKVVLSLEKEQIPYWNKFLQGYYDTSAIFSDTFDQAVQFTSQGQVTVSDEMSRRGIELETSVGTTVFYLGFNMLDPIKSTVVTPGLDVTGKFAKTGIPAAIVTKYLAEHGVVVEKTGLYSFFIMFTIGITKGRWNTLLTALQQFKDDYDKNQPMWRILPEFCQAHPRYERMGLRDLSSIWELILAPETLGEVLVLEGGDSETFGFPDDLWARVVYDFALGHHYAVVHREHLLRSLVPLYLGRTAAYITATRRASAEATERILEAVAVAFERQKPYLVEHWR